jgi:hypothetical protein
VDLERQSITAGEWFGDKVDTEVQYTTLCRSLAEQGVSDPRQYGVLVQERQRLEAEIEQFAALQEQRELMESEVAAQLNACRQTRREMIGKRRQFLRQALAGNRYVRIELEPYGASPKSIEMEIRQALGISDGRFEDDILTMNDELPAGGLVADLLKRQGGGEDEAADGMEIALSLLGQRFSRAASGRGDFGGHLNNYLQRESAKRPEFLDRLLLWTPSDSLKVEYSRSGDGTDFRPIQQASAGQRAAAMLAFLLLHGREPLVLDQPEDDLDNHLIYELVVQQIRERKQHRQLIVVTHNPNIVVNGDAEMVHVMDFQKGQCRVVQAGSLQEQRIRDEVCRVMEGGREAFERRYRRIGGDVSDV